MELPPRRPLIIVMAIAWLNFCAFAAGCFYFGGDAVNGHAEDGRYFLRNHQEIVEVSRAVYVYSYTHAVTVAITTLSVFAVFLWWFARQLSLTKPIP